VFGDISATIVPSCDQPGNKAVNFVKSKKSGWRKVLAIAFHDLTQGMGEMDGTAAALFCPVQLPPQKYVAGHIGTFKRVAAIFFDKSADRVEKFNLCHFAICPFLGEKVESLPPFSKGCRNTRNERVKR
jgi:hypothetical protein